MSDIVFFDAIQKITAGPFPLTALIESAHALSTSGRSDMARQLYKLWIRLNPTDPQLPVAQFNCAVLDSDAGELPAAAELLTAAIAANPDFLQAYINLGGVLERGGSADRGVETWKAMLGRVAPITGVGIEMKVTALKQIGRVFSDHHQSAMAEVALQEALDLVPNQRDVIEQYVALRMSQCKWPIMAPTERVSRKTLMMGVSPLSASCYADDPVLHLGTSVRFVEQSTPEPENNAFDRREAPIDLADRRLRVGYVSSDLRDHAIGYLMAELFELHDRTKVEVFAYYCGKRDEGALNARIKSAVEHWADIRDMSDDAAAGLIAGDGIDILVDVNGHTRDGRPGVFARRPAPIQVNWLGYPGTMGTPFHHYVIADDWIVPPQFEHYYTEKVLRLACYQPNDRKRAIAPDRPSRAEAGLPEDAFVFCSFNGVQKLTRHSYDRWLEILRAVPNSVLWLLDPGAETAQRLADYAEQGGVDRSRLIIAQKLANPFHLARYPLADLFLDSFPYGAHTTASDALWMGVPVLTMSGRSFASRVCGSLVRSAGLPELVCDTPQGFVQRAVELASAPATVAALKAKLELNRPTCPLFDMDALVVRLEALYEEMCADYLAGELPKPDLANLGVYLATAVEYDHDAQEMLGLAPDYDDYYRAKLAVRDLARPLQPDSRLWTPPDAPAEAAAPRRRRAGAR